MAHAGLLPRLTTPGEVEKVDLWRVGVVRRGDAHEGPFAALPAALESVAHAAVDTVDLLTANYPLRPCRLMGSRRALIPVTLEHGFLIRGADARKGEKTRLRADVYDDRMTTTVMAGRMAR